MTLKSPSIVRILGLALLSLSLPGRLRPNEHGGPHYANAGRDPARKVAAPSPHVRHGNAHMKITATPEAPNVVRPGPKSSARFLGLESARAFQQGVRVDPQCAMCYWGLYKAESFYHSTAQGYAARALAQAVALKEHVSARERLYIEAAVAHDKAEARSGRPHSSDSREVELLRQNRRG